MAEGNSRPDSAISSAAAADADTGVGYAEATDLLTSFPATFSGHEVDDTAILLRHTGYGDTNLDGNVNLQDFNRLAANFGTTSGAVWFDGDFDFNGSVNLGRLQPPGRELRDDVR